VYDVLRAPRPDGDKAMTNWIVMDWIEGEEFGHWFTRLVTLGEEYERLGRLLLFGNPGSKEAANEIMAQMAAIDPVVDWSRTEEVFKSLRAALHELRALTPPASGRVGALDGGPLVSWKLDEREVIPSAPDVDSFHRYLLSQVRYASRMPRIEAMAERTWFKADHRLCFTHADLHFANIIVKDDKLAGIIDWECAGWYPEYWEWTQMLRKKNSRFKPSGWYLERLASGLFDGRYEAEVDLNGALQDSCGQYSLPPGEVPGYELDKPLSESPLK